MQTLESLKRQIIGAGELKSIVRTMKAMAASNIGQYESAVASLGDYYNTVALGIIAYLNEKNIGHIQETNQLNANKEKSICAIVFGSDQGFVGQFNDSLNSFIYETLLGLTGKKEVWAVGARIPSLLKDSGLTVTKNFQLPNSINSVTSLIGSILINLEESQSKLNLNEFYIFYNLTENQGSYVPQCLRLLPLDESWRKELQSVKWSSKQIPQVIGEGRNTIKELISEYLFVALFRACAESLASENYCRLGAMQRAEKNIEGLLGDINNAYHRLRQSSIDEELFDVISGFEALKDNI